MAFAIGLLIGSIFSFKFAEYIDRTSQFVKPFRKLMLLIVFLRIAEITLEWLLDVQIQDTLLSITGLGIGVTTFLQAPSVMTLVSELTHPVTTAIPSLIMFWLTGVLTLMICQQSSIV